MKNFFTALFTTVLVFSCLSCGKKGDILPPLVRFPQAAEDVRAAQKADRIILTWQNPTAYEDGGALVIIQEIEIWVLEEKAAEEAAQVKIPLEEFQKTAKLHGTIMEDQIQDFAAEEGPSEGQMQYPYDLSDKDFLSKRYTFGVRIKDKKRYSPFSVLVSLRPMVLPYPPTELKAAVFLDRIEITWKPSLEGKDPSSLPYVKGYNIYRSESEQEPQLMNARLIEGEKYDDRNFVFGQTYKYFIRSSATDTPPHLESEDSEDVEIFARDTFPPEPPEGLISVAGQDFLAISWDANVEDDLEGYRVWRREEGATEFRLLTPDPIKESAYNDRTVEKGKMYAYAVTALDKSGNESRTSKVIIDGIRERMR